MGMAFIIEVSGMDFDDFPETRPASEFHETWSPTENFVDMLKLLFVIAGFAYITVRRSPWRGVPERDDFR